MIENRSLNICGAGRQLSAGRFKVKIKRKKSRYNSLERVKRDV